MPEVTIVLNDGQYSDLVECAARTYEEGFGPADWAREAVESVLASRRLPRVNLGSHGPRIHGAKPDADLVRHRVVRPERICQN